MTQTLTLAPASTQPVPKTVHHPPSAGTIDGSRYWRLADLAELSVENGFRYEIVDGELIVTPAPNRRHGNVATQITDLVLDILKHHHPGWSIISQPINLERETEERTFHCEPDLSIFDRPAREVVADDSIFPVIVIEIVSPSNPANDYVAKVEAYAFLGIPEYCIVDPRNQAVTYLHLDPETGRYQQAAGSALLPELDMEPDTLFADL
jgi:Uma2 family endonuclease